MVNPVKMMPNDQEILKDIVSKNLHEIRMSRSLKESSNYSKENERISAPGEEIPVYFST